VKWPLSAVLFCQAAIMPQAPPDATTPGKKPLAAIQLDMAAAPPARRPAQSGQVRTALAENGMGNRQLSLFFFGNAGDQVEPFLQLFHDESP